MVVEISTLTFPILSVFSLHISQFIAIIVAIGNYGAEQTNIFGPNTFVITVNTCLQ